MIPSLLILTRVRTLFEIFLFRTFRNHIQVRGLASTCYHSFEKWKKHAARLTVLSLFFVCSISYVKAQASFADSLDGRVNMINTAVPFLRIAPDARSGAMGDAGIGMSPDANAVFWNTAKLSFAEKQFGWSASYVPWLRELVNDFYLASLGVYGRVDDLQALTFGLRYFSLGTTDFPASTGARMEKFSPYEFALDAGYSRKLSKHFSTGLNLGFVYSNIACGYSVNNLPIQAGKAVKADFSFFYNHKTRLWNTKGYYNIGATIANIGNKITYSMDAKYKDFLPANFGLGGGLTLLFDEYNKLSFNLDLNKLLVPTPDTLDEFRNESVIRGIYSSFTDAPGGLSEEMREIMFSLGAEYLYQNLFSVRAGFFHEDKTKGGRQFLTAGMGINYKVLGLNFSYLVPAFSGKSPLDNTLRFSLIFDLNGLNSKRLAND